MPKVTIGLDVGDRKSVFCEIDDSGKAVARGSVATVPEALRREFGGRSRCRIILEAGTHSAWMMRELEQLGHEVVVGHAALIYARGRRKNDRHDAEFLARQGRADVTLLHPIQHRSIEAQQHLALIRSRDQLVRCRTKLINHVRGMAKALGGRVRSCSADAFPRRAIEDVPESLRSALVPLLEVIADLTDRIRAYDRDVQALAEQLYPEAIRLQQPKGVGPLTALAFVLLVEDPKRFQRSRDVGAYFGLVPKLDESSSIRPQLRISKAGDGMGRRLLVSAAHYILGPHGPECDLRRHGEKIAARGGNNAKKRAVVAVARKLAVLMHHLWVSGAPYDPDYSLNRRTA